MRIAYLVTYEVHRAGGIQRKLNAQLRTWQAQGHTAGLFAFARQAGVWSGFDGLHVQTQRRNGRLSAPLEFARLVQRVLAWRPDVVYMRFSVWKPAMELLWGRVPVVLELNDLYHSPVFFDWWERPIHEATRQRALQQASGAIAVTTEIADWAKALGACTGVVANGADLAHYPTLTAPDNERPTLVFLGNPGLLWAGIDEIVLLAWQMPDHVFEFIGPTREEHPGAVPDNVIFHGFCDRPTYEAILGRADAALATMGLYRKAMHEASTLKVREYLAYGIPVIAGHHDTDFLNGAPFLLEVPNRPGGCASHAHHIRRFVASWRGRRVPRRAIEHLSFEHKERTRLELIESFCH